MKIVVCVKQVPDTNEVKLDPVTKALIREGVPSVVNPDDRTGIEAALRLRDEIGGSVTALCMGPPQADAALREALAMGCDEAALVSAREFGGSDAWATAAVLSAALKKIGYDIVITGRQAMDGETAQVGPRIAENLGLPQVTHAGELRVEGDRLVVKRRFEDRHHIIEVKPPCLITVLPELAEPRYMHVGGIVDAYRKEVRTFGFDDFKDGPDADSVGPGSPTSIVNYFTKRAKGAGELLRDVNANEAVAAIVRKMEERRLI